MDKFEVWLKEEFKQKYPRIMVDAKLKAMLECAFWSGALSEAKHLLEAVKAEKPNPNDAHREN
jgi:hypothetical protein